MRKTEKITEHNELCLEEEPNFVYASKDSYVYTCLEIYLQMPGQPARLFVGERHESDTMRSVDHFPRRILEWRSPEQKAVVVDHQDMRELLEKLTPHIETIRSDPDTDIDWDGSNMVGRLGKKSQAADHEIETILETDSGTRELDKLLVDEWLHDFQPEQLGTPQEAVQEALAEDVAIEGGTEAVQDWIERKLAERAEQRGENKDSTDD